MHIMNDEIVRALNELPDEARFEDAMARLYELFQTETASLKEELKEAEQEAGRKAKASTASSEKEITMRGITALPPGADLGMAMSKVYELFSIMRAFERSDVEPGTPHAEVEAYFAKWLQ